jgi:arsenite methyltransferase
MFADAKQEPVADIRSEVRKHYGEIAAKSAAGCCGGGAAKSCGCGGADPRTEYSKKIYEAPEAEALPSEVTGLSLGCGDPVTLAQLKPGQVVLDLGSGGGIDCFLAAQRVGAAGRVIGVDMTAEMLEQARANKARMGADNVEFRMGEIEHLPVADSTVDVIISNCVVNLSPDKPQVFREAFRVLRPGGRLAVSDVMTDGPLPDAVRNSLAAWAGCVGGALDVADYAAAVEAAGFVDVHIARTEFDQDTIDAAGQQLGLGDRERTGRKLVIGTGDGFETVDVEDSLDLRSIPPIFSGKLTARKPSA